MQWLRKSTPQGHNPRSILQDVPCITPIEPYSTKICSPDRPRCPNCNSSNVLSETKHKTMHYRCKGKMCYKLFIVRTWTVMEASNFRCQTWGVAIFLLVNNLKSISCMTLHCNIEIAQKSVWLFEYRLREALERINNHFLGSEEADEICMYVKRKNMPKSMWKQLTSAGRSATVGRMGIPYWISATVLENTDA